MHSKLWRVASALAALSLLIAACQPAATQAPAAKPTEAPEQVGQFQIPAIEDGKFNVAMVLIGPHDDGGWSQAHYEGLKYLE